MRITLNPKDLPEKWYNVAPDLGFTPPTLMSSSGYPLGGRHDLEPLAPSGVIKHELEEKERHRYLAGWSLWERVCAASCRICLLR